MYFACAVKQLDRRAFSTKTSPPLLAMLHDLHETFRKYCFNIIDLLKAIFRDLYSYIAVVDDSIFRK